MVQRTNGGVFDDQMITGSLHHFVIEGADFSGAINQYGKPVPGSAAEIIFTNISEEGFIDIMNPNSDNISFALESNRSDWDSASLTAMVQSLGTDVGVDHIDCSVCTVTEVPYIWNLGSGATSFLDLSDTPSTYAGAANKQVTVNSTETGLIFTGPADYIPIPPATLLQAGFRYFVTATGTVTLPALSSPSLVIGSSITILRPARVVDVIVTVSVGFVSDLISTDIGTTNSIVIDASAIAIFIYDGTMWNLQIGAVN
jgi:hypothetical protein